MGAEVDLKRTSPWCATLVVIAANCCKHYWHENMLFLMTSSRLRTPFPCHHLSSLGRPPLPLRNDVMYDPQRHHVTYPYSLSYRVECIYRRVFAVL